MIRRLLTSIGLWVRQLLLRCAPGRSVTCLFYVYGGPFLDIIDPISLIGQKMHETPCSIVRLIYGEYSGCSGGSGTSRHPAFEFQPRISPSADDLKQKAFFD